LGLLYLGNWLLRQEDLYMLPSCLILLKAWNRRLHGYFKKNLFLKSFLKKIIPI